jgi:hypothetical protein
MTRRSFARLALTLPAAAALVAATTAAAPDAGAAARFGPPWISIEYPPSPYDRTTRDAYLLVHAFHHGTPTDFPVAGSAEGLVNGERRTVKLEFTTTSRTGVYALRKQWPAEGRWALVVRVLQGKEDAATALVRIGADGQVAQVTVPTRDQDGYRIPRSVTAAEVDAALRSAVASR